MTGKLEGKVIVVSGGTQGLGEAIARQVVADGAAGLVIAGRSADRGAALAKELTDLGTPTSFVEADMEDPAAPRVVIDAADKQFGVIHGVNARAPLFLIQAAAEVMRREGVAGSCVSIGSTSGHGGQPFILSYCVSKGALETMTRNLAYSLMRHNIRVNVVSPGWMDTESEDATQRKFHGATDGWLEQAEAGQPMGRLIKPPEVAKVVAFYLSDDSGMLTGNIVDYDQSVLGAGDAPKPSLQETPQ
jgi:NAD(P)-dependent dehydrogenase (short-subunit alcohol dehydrogenase family)